ncbi:MAG: hypothetical protein IPJ77_10335 [Planctomycetes bacterium]|nr:hypothetical protein [Planctomycetota bacterium]
MLRSSTSIVRLARSTSFVPFARATSVVGLGRSAPARVERASSAGDTRSSMRASIARALAVAAALSMGSVLHAQLLSPYATQVVNYSPGSGGGTFVAANALGAPTGGGLSNGSLDVASVGVGGSLTLGFDVTIANGPGVDFTVCENAFVFAGESFSEVAYVEVSTNGVAFARLPSRYTGPATGLPSFTAPFGTYGVLTGTMPVLANPATNTLDPLDPAWAGGDAFDLADLANDPLVTSGVVDLAAIHFVRIVDVPHGTGTDAAGNVIWDNSGATGTADVDAVCVIQHAGTVVAGQPTVDLFLDAQGYLNLRVEDPDGGADLDGNTIHCSFNGAPIGFRTLARRLVPNVTPTANGYVLRSNGPFVGSGLHGVVTVSVRDVAGHFSADQLSFGG